MDNLLIQPINSIVLHVRSKDANQNVSGYNTDFNVNLLAPIISKSDEEIHISIMSAEIPYSFYNISSELENNTLIYDTNQTLTFDSQDYSIDDVVDFFNADTSFSAIFTTTYNEQKNKISFQNTTASSHTIDLNISNINKVIGFDEDDTSRTITAGSTLTSDFVCNMATVHSIFIKSSMATGNVLSTRAGNSTTLQKISVDVNSNGIIYLNQSDFRQISVSQVNVIDNINFRITDQNDNLLQLNNVNFEVSFLFNTYPRYTPENSSDNNRRSLMNTVNQAINNIPTQNMILNQPVLNQNNPDIDNTHPIENKTEIEHKADRLVLDNLLDIVENQDS